MARSPAAERGLNDLIERRATERESANTAADLWKRDEAKYRAGLEFSRMKEWQEHYLHLADIHERLCEENRQRAFRLLDEASRR